MRLSTTLFVGFNLSFYMTTSLSWIYSIYCFIWGPSIFSHKCSFFIFNFSKIFVYFFSACDTIYSKFWKLHRRCSRGFQKWLLVCQITIQFSRSDFVSKCHIRFSWHTVRHYDNMALLPTWCDRNTNSFYHSLPDKISFGKLKQPSITLSDIFTVGLECVGLLTTSRGIEGWNNC